MRAAIEDPAVTYILGLDRQSRIAPLSQFPQHYAAWVPEALADYRDQTRAALEQAERIANL